MIDRLLRLLGIHRRRRGRRIYAQPPMPPPPPVARRRHKATASMPLPPGYIQSRDAADPAPPPLPKRVFGPASMPLPPGSLQGPPQSTDSRTRTRDAGKEGRESPVSLVRALEQATPAIRRSRRTPPAPGGDTAPRPPAPPRKPRWSPMPGLRAAWGRWRPRLARAGRFGLFYMVPLAVLVVTGALVLREMRNVGIVVMPLTVPESLAASGRTADVVARHLADRIELVRRQTLLDHTERPDNSLSEPLPTVSLPAPLLSRRGIAARLRDLFGTPVERVTGDVVQNADGRLTLRLHMTGAGQIAEQDNFTPADLDERLERAAPAVWRVAAPTLFAWYVVNAQPRPAVVLAELNDLLHDDAPGRKVTDPATRTTITMLVARTMVRNGDSRGALAVLESLGPEADRQPLAWYVRSMALLNLGQSREANDAENKVLALAPNSAWAHRTAARMYLSTGRFNEAYQEARAARRIQPADGVAAILESAALVSLNRIPEAVEVARQAAQRSPGQPGIQEALGTALLAARRPDLALGLFDSELKLHPERISTLIARGRALQLLNRNPEALASAEAALRVMPNNGTAMLLRAWTLLAVKRPQDALIAFEAMLQARPDMVPLLQGKAAALRDLGRTADAVVVLEHLLKLMPGNPRVKQELDQLKATMK